MAQWDTTRTATLIQVPTTVRPDNVLYEYDDPLLFVSTDTFGSQLFYKMESLSDGSSLYLSTPTSSRVITALEKGRLSVRGALSDSNHHRVVNITPSFDVLRFWECELHELDEDHLPRAGVGLASQFGLVPDTLNQSNSFLSVRLAGEALHRGTMSFGTYNTIISNIYEAFRRILSSSIVMTRGFRIDYPVYEPSFGSVIVAIQEPVVLTKNTEASAKDRAATTERVSEEIRKNREAFLKGIDLVISAAKKGDLSTALAKDYFDVLDQIKDIIPTEGSRGIDRLEFNAAVKSSLKSYSIDEETGERLRKAYKIVERLPRTHRGTIMEINAASGTFIILASNRQVTCVFPPDLFYEIRQDLDTFKIGTKVQIKGLLQKRPRRDKLFVRELPLVTKG